MREKHANPLIIDLIDNHDVFLNQFTKRRSFYNEKNYKIIRYNNQKYSEYINHLKTFKLDTTTILSIEQELLENNTSTNYWNILLPNTRRKKGESNNTSSINKDSDVAKNNCLITID